MKESFHDYAYSAFHLAFRGDGSIEQSEIRAVLSSLANLGDAWNMRPTKAMKAAVAVSQEYLADRAAKSPRELDTMTDMRLQALGEQLEGETLYRLYKELKVVAAADGDMALGEKHLLQRVRESWNIPINAS